MYSKNTIRIKFLQHERGSISNLINHGKTDNLVFIKVRNGLYITPWCKMEIMYEDTIHEYKSNKGYSNKHIQ